MKSSDLIHTIESGTKTNITSNGEQLTLNDLTLLDQQYYGCFINGSSLIVNAYYLFVRSKN